MLRIVLRMLLVVALLGLVSEVALAQGRGGGGGKKGGGSKIDHTALQTLPIKLGTSGGNANDIANGYCSSGTLGALLQDESANINYYILSNAHVLAHDVDASATDPDIAVVGDPVTQPGLVDTRCGQDDNAVVATLATTSSLTDEGGAIVDAAVAWVTPGSVQEDGEILAIGVIGSTPAAAFPGQGVKKSGRTTGLTTSQVDAVNATVNVEYSTEANGTTFVRTFTGQTIVRNRRSKFLNSGDSGSVMVEDVSSAPRPVGLLYAGSNRIAVANPAQDVLDYLNQIPVASRIGTLSFVGVAAAGAAESQPTGISRAIAVQEANAARLLSVPGGVGHGVGVANGSAVVKVFVDQITPEARRAIPARIDGVTVVLEAVGRVVAF